MELSNQDHRAVPLSPEETNRLVASAVQGNSADLARLLDLHTSRLTRMIALRIDARLSRRVDVDDVVQEVQFQASQHLQAYLRTPELPFYLWLRGVATNILLEVHRRHLGTQMRDARREVPMDWGQSLTASSSALAWHLADTGTSPSNAAMRAELRSRLETIIDRLPPSDKEILALRHFEQLSPTETAQVLRISDKAAGMRYLRALGRLREAVAEVPGELSAWRI
jgi:RNA polymerase sigma-70 factor (ECF subfamily)